MNISAVSEPVNESRGQVDMLVLKRNSTFCAAEIINALFDNTLSTGSSSIIA